MPTIPLKRLSGIQTVAFLLRQHNRRATEPVTSDDRYARLCHLAETNFYSVGSRCHLNAPLFRSVLAIFAAIPGSSTMHDRDWHVRVDCAPMCPGHCPTPNTGTSSCVFAGQLMWKRDNGKRVLVQKMKCVSTIPSKLLALIRINFI